MISFLVPIRERFFPKNSESSPLLVHESLKWNRQISVSWRLVRSMCWILGFVIILYSLFTYLSSLSSSHRTIILLDTSLSMAVEDIEGSGGGTISRFETAKNLIHKLIQIPGEYGLMTFAKNPILRTPLTDNIKFLENSINAISLVDQASWTDIEAALAQIRKLYISSGVRLVLITDGWWEIDISRLDRYGISLEIIGIGTLAGGSIPSGTDVFGKSLYKMQDGEIVISARNMKTISTLQEVFQGKTTIIEWEWDIEKYMDALYHQKIYPYNSADKEPYLLIIWVFFILISHTLPRYKLPYHV